MRSSDFLHFTQELQIEGIFYVVLVNVVEETENVQFITISLLTLVMAVMVNNHQGTAADATKCHISLSKWIC